jgi:thiol-disulfide isomerase/thioredoxin
MRLRTLSLRTICVLALLSMHNAYPATLDFSADTLVKIQARYAGKPFILSVWSVNDCVYCLKEMAMFGELAKTHPALPLVLVSTDSPDSIPQIDALLARHGLADKPSWVFNDDIPERPRMAIDPQWRGELPRTYLYDAAHQRVAVSGVMDEQKLRAWLTHNP